MNRSRYGKDEGSGFSAEDFRRRAQEAYDRTADEVERAILQGRQVTEQFGNGSDFGDRTGQNRQTGTEAGANGASKGT